MKLHDIISISPHVLENILLEEIKKIPGVSGQSVENIKVLDDGCEVNVYLTPFDLLTNIYSLAKEIQSAISFYITKQFDIQEGVIKINIIVDSVNKRGK